MLNLNGRNNVKQYMVDNCEQCAKHNIVRICIYYTVKNCESAVQQD